MKFSIKQNLLWKNLNNISKALTTKTIIPILTGIKFELKHEGLYITCSDDDITIQSFIKIDQLETYSSFGKILLPGKYIVEIIKKMPNEIINFDSDDLKVIITTKSSDYKLNAMNVKEYPSQSLKINEQKIVIDKNELKDLINQTSFAVYIKEDKPLLRGINIKINNQQLIAYATDSYRLAKKIITLKNNNHQKIEIVIPGNNLIELAKLLNDEIKTINMYIFNNAVLFQFENIFFKSRILNGTYPNLDHVFLNEYKIILNLEIEEFYNLVDRASLLSDDDKKIVTLEAYQNEIKILSDTVELGKIEERGNLKKEIKKEIKIAFNAKYMLEALRSFKNKDINICLIEDIKPLIIKEIKNDNLIQVILPVKIY